MTVSTRTRFEVFKRDRFVCAYCGRTPPDALLHVDHITPVALGGTDDMANLITACSTCNLGKSSVPLDESRVPAVSRASVDDMAERIEQAKAYLELQAQMRSLVDQQVEMVTARWARVYGAEVEERPDGSYWVLPGRGFWPREQSIRTIIKRLPLEQVLEAVDITSDWSPTPTNVACRYFYGICWKRIKAADQR